MRLNAIDVIASAARSTGYRKEAIFRDFAFADVLDPHNQTRRVSLAAFTRTPPSYRSAALAAVPAGSGQTAKLVAAHRALGAPLLFVIHGKRLSLWQVRGDTPKPLREHVPLDDVPALFEENRRAWHPDAIHRAKSIGAVDRSQQLDFVDIGLLPAVEGEIHAKLDRLLQEMLEAAKHAQTRKSLQSSLLFPTVFRLLAAKVLLDRGHPRTKSWNIDDLTPILRDIESYYSLSSIPVLGKSALPALTAAWNCLRKGISFSNISSDDLAFVYENTLVTPDTRRQFGTHSTPRQLAEYAVSRLNLHHFHSPDELRIYEPFAGAGVFLVSALRHIRDLLPADWSDAKRHDFLVERLSGDEIDAFACEVAALSLVLADYPNRNGWRVSQSDLFLDGKLQICLAASNVVLCNPPFEDFTDDQRQRYGLLREHYSQPIEVLNAALDAHPRALAFVLPRGFILQRKFARQRRRLEQLYSDLELVELPDRLFSASGFETSLVIAKHPRKQDDAPVTSLRSTVVSDSDRATFLKTGRVTATRYTQRPFPNSQRGDLWIPALSKIWDYLAHSPCIGDFLAIHRGIEWHSHQERAWASERRPGFRVGLHTAQNTSQFLVPHPVWLDCREHRLRGNAIRRPWDTPKLVTNAGRLSRGPWRIGASVDTEGLICSQQYLALWPRQSEPTVPLQAFAAVLNGPLANAFLAVHSPEKGIRITAVKRIPVPQTFPETLTEMVDEYVRLLRHATPSEDRKDRLTALLLEIDAAVLHAYDLPAPLERELLGYFPAKGRPVAHFWQHWNGADAVTGLTLAERLSTRFERKVPIGDIFVPLPPEEAAALRTYWP